MSDTELLPCPMCGGKARLRRYPLSMRLDKNSDHDVQCEVCRIHTYMTSSAEAVAIWNRRVPALTEPTLAAILELCNCVEALADACFVSRTSRVYLDDVATVRAWLDKYRAEEPA